MIHQIWINLGKKMSQEMKQNRDETERIANYLDIPYKFWEEKDIENLLNDYQCYKVLFYEMKTNPISGIVACDFIRYLILYHCGGIYLDLDVRIVSKDVVDYLNLPLWSSTIDGRFARIAVMGSIKGDNMLLDIMKEAEDMFYRNVEMPIYTIRKARFVFYTTGHYMLRKFPINLIKNMTMVRNMKRNRYNHADLYLTDKVVFLDSGVYSWAP